MDNRPHDNYQKVAVNSFLEKTGSREKTLKNCPQKDVNPSKSCAVKSTAFPLFFNPNKMKTPYDVAIDKDDPYDSYTPRFTNIPMNLNEPLWFYLSKDTHTREELDILIDFLDYEASEKEGAFERYESGEEQAIFFNRKFADDCLDSIKKEIRDLLRKNVPVMTIKKIMGIRPSNVDALIKRHRWKVNN